MKGRCLLRNDRYLLEPDETAHPARIGWYPPEPPAGETVVAIGTFDGVHLGHQAIVGQAAELALKQGAACVAVTFEPHPRHVLNPASALPILTPLPERVRLLLQSGAAAVAVITFDRKLAALDAETFVDCVLRRQLRARGVVAGFNFGFGRNRSGSAATLERFGEKAGLAVRIVQPVESGGRVVSSSEIRRLLQEGDVKEAARLLGRAYRVGGVVVKGDGRGRALGYPTANVRPDPLQLVPADGVYLALLDGMPALAVISARPTFGQDARRWLEVHVLEGWWELYGRQVSVDLLQKLRPIVRFQSAQRLAAQIEADRRSALAYFAAAREPHLQQRPGV